MQAVLGEGAWRNSQRDRETERQRDRETEREEAEGQGMVAGPRARHLDMEMLLKMYWRGKSTAQGL